MVFLTENLHDASKTLKGETCIVKTNIWSQKEPGTSFEHKLFIFLNGVYLRNSNVNYMLKEEQTQASDSELSIVEVNFNKHVWSSFLAI